MSERLNVKNLVLEPEPKPARLSIETVQEQLEPFLLDTFKNEWDYTEEQIERAQANLKAEILLPKDADYSSKKADPDLVEIGKYTLNPDTATIDWETVDPAKFKIHDLSNMRNKSLDQVANHIVDAYGTTHYIPGLEYWKYILENPDKIPTQIKKDIPADQTGNGYFTFGSLVCDQDGYWIVPYVLWTDDWGNRSGRELSGPWDDGCRVILLPKDAVPKSSTPDATPPQPKTRNF